MKNIYIDNTVSLWGTKNGEVNMELEDGTVLTWNAYNLMRDIPHIVPIIFDEVMYEKQEIQKSYKKLAKFIVK